MFVLVEKRKTGLLEFNFKSEIKSIGFILYIAFFIVSVIGTITEV